MMILKGAATLTIIYYPVFDCSTAAVEINHHFVTPANKVLQYKKLSLIVVIVDLLYTWALGVLIDILFPLVDGNQPLDCDAD